MDIFEKLREIICEQFNVEEEYVTKKASFIEDLGADSIDSVELMMAVETGFGIEISEEDAENMYTVGNLMDYLEQKIK